ncbi:MAG TPA: hypothetical protein EYP19_10560 [Desulfobacterales bacterium]|nr:hypothetical protein [Desulfobacterales bacterium]
MRVEFAVDALKDQECWRYLDDVLAKVEDGWHEWTIEDPESVESSDWLQGSNRPHLRKLYEEVVVRDAYRSSGLLHRKVWSVSFSTGSDSITPKAAAKLFGEPLMVYVENRYTDRLFLDTILEFLAPDELRDFLGNCEGNPFKYDSGGGVGELGKLIEDHVREMDVASWTISSQ